MIPSINSYILSNPIKHLENNKLFLPWKITTDNNIIINISNIYIASDFYNNKKLINCKLCNETSNININSKEYKILFPSLTELYCIDLGELFNNDEFFISSNIILDFYISNINNNSVKFELFYPVIEFHSNNYSVPLFNIYGNHSIYLKENIIIKETIVLGEYSVLDKYGYFGNLEKLFSLWGTNRLYSEYINVNNTENSSILFYKLNIIFDLKKIHYKRYHKNIFVIFVDIFPICYILYKFIRCILKPFILAESNAKIFELIFENLVEKEDKREMFKKLKFKSLGANAQVLKKKINMHNIKNVNNTKINKQKDISRLNKNIDNNNSNLDIKKTINNNRNNNNKDLNKNNNKDLIDINQNSQKEISIMKLSKACRKKSRRSVDFGSHNVDSKNNNNLFLINQNILINKNVNDTSIHVDGSKYDLNQDVNISNISPKSIYKHSRIRKIKLFPYKFFFFSLFLKNYEIINCKCLFSIKYKKIFTFINQILDINSYLILKKEFEIMKHLYCNKEDLALVESNKKINVNSTKFNREIKECIENNNFYIFYNKAK